MDNGGVNFMDNAQELIKRLNHSGKKLSKSHRRIAECIVAHYDKVVFMTASKLGEYVGVSESTVVRFASALGYSGYPQLQKALQELLRHRLTATQRFELTSDMDHVQVLNRVLKGDMLLTVPAHCPIDGAVMLVKWKQHCTARKIKWDGKRLMLLSYDHELDAEPVLPDEVQFVGRCARLEAAL